MRWQIEFYAGVEDDILALPPKIQARMLRLLEMVEQHGAHLGSPHTEAMGEGLFEIRATKKMSMKTLKEKALQNPAVKAEYDRLAPESSWPVP